MDFSLIFYEELKKVNHYVFLQTLSMQQEEYCKTETQSLFNVDLVVVYDTHTNYNFVLGYGICHFLRTEGRNQNYAKLWRT